MVGASQYFSPENLCLEREFAESCFDSVLVVQPLQKLLLSEESCRLQASDVAELGSHPVFAVCALGKSQAHIGLNVPAFCHKKGKAESEDCDNYYLFIVYLLKLKLFTGLCPDLVGYQCRANSF